MKEQPVVLFEEHVGETFAKRRVALDGRRFDRCVFVDAQLVYSGGPCEVLENCRFEGTCSIYPQWSALATGWTLDGLRRAGMRPPWEELV